MYTCTLNGQTKQTTTTDNNVGALPISQTQAQDKALIGTGTAAHLTGDTHQIGTKPLVSRPPGSLNQHHICTFYFLLLLFFITEAYR